MPSRRARLTTGVTHLVDVIPGSPVALAGDDFAVEPAPGRAEIPICQVFLSCGRSWSAAWGSWAA
jgi:hypothetical protein